MAKKTARKTTANPRFFEVVFRGKPKVVKAFLKGLMMGATREVKVFYSFDDGVHHEGKAEKFKEMFGLRATDCHVIVDAEASAYLKRMAKQIAAETGLEISAHRAIKSAGMRFEYHTFAPQYSTEIVALLENLPPGLRLRGYRHEEKRYPAAKGVEAYSAVHDYESSGSGAVTGRVDLLIGLKREMSAFPLIKTEDIVLK